MNLLQRYLMKQFIPVLIFSLLFFILLLELGDLFANLWKYLSNDVPMTSILSILWLYVPKCISYSMPMAILFASSYTMGNLYARNELTSIFASGYPLHFLVVPLLALGMILSIFMFFYEDGVVIHSVSDKAKLTKLVLKQEISLSNTNVVVLSNSGRTVYAADYYQDKDKKLYSLMIIDRNTDGDIQTVIISPVAEWTGSDWSMAESVTYSYLDPLRVTMSLNAPPITLNEPPETFKRNVTSVEELRAVDAKKYIESIRKAGLPHAEQLSNYYKRYSFPLTIFIVLFFSISLGGKFRKNILLMSLLLSLSVAVLYYVTQMITMLFAKWEYISPLAGAWFPVILFLTAGAFILRHART